MFYFNSSNLFVTATIALPAVLIVGTSVKNTLETGEIPSLMGIIFSVFLTYLWAYNIYKNHLENEKRKRCKEKIIGIVTSMRDSKLAQNERRFLNIHVQYLSHEKEILYVPPDFKYHSPPGSPIPLKYNPNNPEEVVIDYEAIKQGDWDDSPTQTGNTQNQFGSNDINSIIQTALAGGSVQPGKHGNVNVVVQDSEPTIIKASDINASDNPELASIIEQLKQTATTQKPTSAAKPQENSTSMIKITDISPQFFRGANIYEISGEVFNSDLNGKRLTFSQTLTTEQAADVFPGRMLPCNVSGKPYDLQATLVF
ncbi:DUF3592 domain-containing protein [Bacterioplanoides sp.]|uniref:DUF3592 domain-containing protein n=1 Tax=Bacterioplanoides sp. TaxID=2066072 RepID=UPI003B00097F